MRRRDITGQRFGRLVAVADDGHNSKKGARMWICRCDCGRDVVKRIVALVSGNTKSCGCLAREQKIGFVTRRARQAPDPAPKGDE